MSVPYKELPNSIKDLGIYFRSDLNFKMYYKIILNKLYKILGIISTNTK